MILLLEINKDNGKFELSLASDRVFSDIVEARKYADEILQTRVTKSANVNYAMMTDEQQSEVDGILSSETPMTATNIIAVPIADTFNIFGYPDKHESLRTSIYDNFEELDLPLGEVKNVKDLHKTQ